MSGAARRVGVIALGLGAAIVLCDTKGAEAAYYGYGYYGYGYGYGYGYRSARPERSYAVRPSRSAVKKRDRKNDDQAKKDPQSAPKPIKGPLTIVVSVGEQRVRVFDGTAQVAESPTSTGTRAFPTPMGVFTVIQKNRHHYSNLYNGAPMPYMQRLTWSGTAMHTGVLPGYPASHGCIRLPNSFAARLWTMTKLGTRVIVARHGLQPAEIEHAQLDSLKRKPPEPPVAESAAAGKVASNPGPVTDGLSTPMPKVVGFGDEPKAGESPAAAAPTAPSAKPEAAPTPSATPAPADPVAPAVAEPPKPALKPGPVAIFVSKKEGKLFVRKGFEPVFDVPVKIARPDVPLGTHVFTATDVKADSLALQWVAVSLPAEARAEPRADKRAKRGEKAAGKAEPAPPAGPSASASEALDRIELPPEAIERLAEMLAPGASLIISDKGLGPQTGKGTEFIVLSR